MTVEVDPKRHEAEALESLADFRGRRVLEVGSGQGRLTWRYAGQASRVTAVEPFRPAHDRAAALMPAHLRDRVTLENKTFVELAGSALPSSFDLVFLSWSL